MTVAPSATAPFSLGVASFDPLPDRVLLWTRLDEPGPCRWEVATDLAFADVVASGTADADPGSGVVHVDATGLRPGTQHWYRFTAGGHASPVGRTRTLPGEGAERLRIGAACCARYGQSRFTAYGALAGADVDLVVHLGDYIYEDTKWDCEGREPEPPHDCVTLDDYRTRHAQARRDPDLQALHARHPMVVIWDDHDLADNAWRGGAATHDEASQGPWSERMAAALQAHHEFLPKRLADPGDVTTAWRALDAGDLVRIVCTETRAHRDEPAGIDGTPPATAPARTMLGDHQAAWLDGALRTASSRWVVLLSGTVVSELEIPAPEALDGVLPEKYAIVEGCATNTDQWDGYRDDRRRLTAALAARDGGAVVLSGDIHSSWAIEGPQAASGEPAAVELVCPPAATTPIGRLAPGVGAVFCAGVSNQLHHVRWVDIDHHGYLTLDVRPDRADAAWWWVEPGDVARAELGRRWTVPRSKPAALVDPEPPVERGPDAPVAGRRRRRGRRAGALALAAAVVVAVRRFLARR